MSEHFYVHLVESPSSDDLLNNKMEGHVLYQALCISRIDAGFLIAVDESSFWEAVGERLLARIQADNYQRWPILHLSAHGNKDGIELTNKKFLTWESLGRYFRKLNKVLGGRLIVAMSSCEGSWSITEALRPQENPFFAVVAPTEKIDLSDLAIGFSSFYHVLSKTWNLPQSLEAMKSASANPNFCLQESELAKKDYKNWLFRKNIQAALARMQDQGMLEAPPSPPQQ